MKKLLSLVILLFISGVNLYSMDTLNVPLEYPTIQSAIDSSADGDLVLIDEGVYFENIYFNGKAITVASRYIIDNDDSHIINTIINGSQPVSPDMGSVVYFVGGEDTNSVLCGLTITGGTGTFDSGGRGGGGIVVISGAKICHNRIVNNSVASNLGFAGGGGIYAAITSLNFLLLQDNLITDNLVIGGYSSGGGIYIYAEGKAVILRNNISDNEVDANFVSVGGGIYCASDSLSVVSISIKRNRISSNSVSTASYVYAEGGGVFLDGAKTEFRNNLVSYNSAEFGGGISLFNLTANFALRSLLNKIKYSSIIGKKTYPCEGSGRSDQLPDDCTFINNTLVNNNSYTSGGAIQTTGIPVKLINSIVWGNTSPDNTQLSGSIIIEYSDVEGGATGTGNIDLDPDFADTTNFYLTENSSPCIDAGNPETVFDDVEDPLNPGHPLFPGLGTLRNDMGASGGNPETDVNNLFTNAPMFQQFLDRVNSAPYPERQAIADSFLNSVNSFPYIENNTAYYLYTGSENQVTVPGDANNWLPDAFPMTRIDGTNLWYRGQVFEPDARLDYKFVTNGVNWILDPRNPRQVTGGYGPNSELAMPGYVDPPEIEYYPDIPHGTTFDTTFFSVNLNNLRTIRVYMPPGYNPTSSQTYPVILFHDGLEYTSLGYARNIIDYLLHENLIDPIIAVFVPPVNRDAEYAFEQREEFSAFIVDELMPYIDSRYRTRTSPSYRAMIGFSFGGLISTQICYNHPESFGLCAPLSPAYWPNDKEVLWNVINGQQKDLKFYLDWGSYEVSIAYDGRNLKDAIINKGYQNVEWNEWHEGHSWGNWYAHTDLALEHFFPKTTEVANDNISPNEFRLIQNYPNPFNPETIIMYSVPRTSKINITVYDILGREVATLINEEKPAGNYTVKFSAGRYASGLYFYCLKATPNDGPSVDFTQTKKMVLMK